jgi:NADH:ubiquinone oxidoreductase subunit K
MTDAVLMFIVIGVIAVALAVDLAALVGWLRRRKP